jgi:outer membrane lipoprotein-sorting protein
MSTFAASLKRLQALCKAKPVSCRYLLFALLLSTTLLASCAPVRPKRVGDQMTQGFAEMLMQEWSENSSQIISVQGLAKVKVFTTENSLSGTQVILAEKPDRLRAETLSPFGSPLLLLAADGEKLGVLLPARNIYYTGAASPANLGRFTRIPLRLSDLVSFLLYQPPMIDASSEEAFELGEDGWLLIRKGSSRRQELIFNHERQLVGMSYFDHDQLLLKITYGKFSENDDRFPLLFNIEIPEQKTTASLEFSDPETNGRLRPGIFQLTPPEGVTVVSLDEE